MGRTKKQSEEVPQNTNIVEDATDNVSETKLELDLGITQLEGVGDVTEKKLKGFGVTSLRDICVRGAREISEITGVTKSAADQWVFNAQKILESQFKQKFYKKYGKSPAFDLDGQLEHLIDNDEWTNLNSNEL